MSLSFIDIPILFDSVIKAYKGDSGQLYVLNDKIRIIG